MSNELTIKEGQRCTLRFTHLTGKSAQLWFELNPLTGDWIQEHKIGEDRTAYATTKAACVSLARAIVTKSKRAGLPCLVEIKNAKQI